MPARKVLKRTKNGRYTLGGRFISARRAAAVRKARKNPGAKKRKRTTTPRRRKRVVRIAKANPPRRKRRVARRKTATRRNPVAKKRRTTRRRRATTARRNPSWRWRTAAKKAAATRKRKAAARSRAAKKAARTRARRYSVPPVPRTGRVGTANRARRNPSKRWQTQRGTRGRYKKGARSKKTAAVQRRPGGRRTARIAVTRRKNRKGNYRYSARYSKNPMNTIKRNLPIYGGMLGIRALSGLVDGLVKQYAAASIPAQVLPFVPAGGAFLFATMVAPKMKLFKGKTLEGMQLGATVLLFDAVVKKVVSMIPAQTGIAGSVVGALAGYDDMGVQGYGYGEYIAGDRGRDFPPPHPMGAFEVNEAMALDEYVAAPMGGYNVEEALAGSEAAYMQSGGAAGTLAKTVFSY